MKWRRLEDSGRKMNSSVDIFHLLNYVIGKRGLLPHVQGNRELVTGPK
jgi:hypothetical protein